ncbi:pyridoxal phosphate-dependent transferase [Cladochytrium replicatum]|nr:pyridoxal phosphate-dependent transferase [Cladochytrium replicatum]
MSCEMERAAISELARANLSRPSILIKGFAACSANPYHPDTNPSGLINLGTAENKLVAHKMAEKISQFVEINAEILCYGAFEGSLELRTAVANMYGRTLKFPASVALQPDNVMITNGCAGAVNILTEVLCNKGDGVLLPAPFYGGFDFDIRSCSGAKIVPVYTKQDDLVPTIAELEHAYEAAEGKHIKIKYMLLCNPVNPTGRIMEEDVLRAYLKFAESKNIHCVVDEIYALSTWGTHKFVSALALEDVPDPSRLHVVWSLSKDFSGSGLRIGAIFSRSQTVLSACKTYAHTSAIPNFLSTAAAKVLSDETFIDAFIAENHALLRDNYVKLSATLDAKGIPHIPAQAGFFVWMDLGKYVAAAARIAGRSEAEGETALFELLLEEGIYFAPGSAFFDDRSGFFRLLFAAEWKDMQLALERIFAVLGRLTVSCK